MREVPKTSTTTSFPKGFEGTRRDAKSLTVPNGKKVEGKWVIRRREPKAVMTGYGSVSTTAWVLVFEVGTVNSEEGLRYSLVPLERVPRRNHTN